MVLLYNFFAVFSIRLGSIIVASIHLIEGLSLAITSMIWAARPDEVSSQISEWTKEKDLLFVTSIIKNVTDDPSFYLNTCSGLSFFYTFTCVLLILGALCLNMWLVIPFLIMELAKLLILTSFVVVFLLLLKKNSLDLGLLMGGSIGGGFFLLFLFYLWSCPLSLCQALIDLNQDKKKTVMTENEVTKNGKQSIELTDVNLSKPSTANVLWNPSMWDPDPYTNGAVGSFYIE